MTEQQRVSDRSSPPTSSCVLLPLESWLPLPGFYHSFIPRAWMVCLTLCPVLPPVLVNPFLSSHDSGYSAECKHLGPASLEGITEIPLLLPSQTPSLLQTRRRPSSYLIPTLPATRTLPTHSSVLAWRIPGTVGPGGLPSMGSHRVGHD